ncbi:MAG: hypothetical protein WCJ36_00905 [Candidatus Saccharibacteria bacterium]
MAIDKNGGLAVGYADASTYRLRVSGTGYFSSTISGGASISAGSSIAAGTSMSLTTTLTDTLTTTGQTHVGGPILNGPVATALLPSQNSPVTRFSSQAWNGFATKINAMDIYVNPDSEAITRARMAFKTTTVNGYADASEIVNITTDGALNVIGRAQPSGEVFDYVAGSITAVYTDVTNLVSSFGNITGDVLNVTGDCVYFGKRDTFSAIQIVISTAKSTGGTFAWEYSTTGDTWSALTVTDGTVSGSLGPLSQSGTVSFTIPGNWTTFSSINSVGPLYFVRLRVTGSAFTTEPTLQLALPNSSTFLTGEIFSDTTFDVGTSKWAVTGDWAYTTGDYTFTYATGVGTLYQTSANFKNPAKPDTWYRFRYQVGVAGPAGTTAWIGPEFACDNTYFQVSSTTEVDVFFKSNYNPGNFVIYTTATTTSGLMLYGVSLTEMKGGDVTATGKGYFIAGTKTPSIETNAVTPTDLTITTGAAKTLVLSTPVYNDIYMGVAAAKIPATNYPDWSTFTTNTSAYVFKIDDHADLSTIEMVHGYKEGTDIEVHLHIATNGTNDATARKVKYTVYYTWANPGTVSNQFIAESSLTAELDIPANTLDKSSLYLTMGNITGTNMKVGAQVKFRIKRVTGTGTEPIDNPFVDMVGIHYQTDTIGSRQPSAK